MLVEVSSGGLEVAWCAVMGTHSPCPSRARASMNVSAEGKCPADGEVTRVSPHHGQGLHGWPATEWESVCSVWTNVGPGTASLNVLEEVKPRGPISRGWFCRQRVSFQLIIAHFVTNNSKTEPN